ncbi:VWA domain-containing protein [Cryptosporangium japonicum]|uniref:VWFA domain-containing protein n=1 Tax=Cryptosporangium japonicum TaxID=80872 RepID=A0ABN0TLQ0_9ACTN
MTNGDGADPGPGPGPERLYRRYLVAFGLATCAIGGPAAATDLPDSAFAWGLLVVTAMIGGVAATEAMDAAIRRVRDKLSPARNDGPPAPDPDWEPSPQPGPGPGPGPDLEPAPQLGSAPGTQPGSAQGTQPGSAPGTQPGSAPETQPDAQPEPVGAPAVRDRSRPAPFVLPVLVVVVALLVGISIPQVRDAVYFWTYGCRPPPTLRVLTTAEGLAPVSELARAYERASADEHDGCPAADLYVYAADPGAAPIGDDRGSDRDYGVVSGGLANGWPSESLGTFGPRPDVWLPDASVDVARVRALTGGDGTLIPERVPSLGVTPVVLGVPRGVFERRPDRWHQRSWADVLAEAEEQGIPVLRPGPPRSATGEIATEYVYRSVGATPDERADAVQRVERQLGLALGRGRYTAGDALALLCQRRERADVASAMIVTEQQLVRYNQGRPLGDNCPLEERDSTGRRLDAAKQLVAVYPTGTGSLDHPFVELRWPDRTRKPAKLARAWLEWLTSDEGAEARIDVGLRPPSGANGAVPVSEPLTEPWGADAAALFERTSPSVQQVVEARRQYDNAKPRARTLVLLDTSGSMGDAVSTASRRNSGQTAEWTRLDAARQALRAAAPQVAPDDEVGVWGFSSTRIPPERFLPVEKRDPGALGPAMVRLDPVRAEGGTPLYRAIEAGLAGLDGSSGDRTVTLIVVTDGEDTDTAPGRPTPDRLRADASAAGIRVSVVAMGDASCAGPALHTLTTATGGECVDAASPTLAPALVGLFDAVRGGRGAD